MNGFGAKLNHFFVVVKLTITEGDLVEDLGLVTFNHPFVILVLIDAHSENFLFEISQSFICQLVAFESVYEFFISQVLASSSLITINTGQ